MRVHGQRQPPMDPEPGSYDGSVPKQLQSLRDRGPILCGWRRPPGILQPVCTRARVCEVRNGCVLWQPS
jgi:hypothetical protein